MRPYIGLGVLAERSPIISAPEPEPPGAHGMRVSVTTSTHAPSL